MYSWNWCKVDKLIRKGREIRFILRECIARPICPKMLIVLMRSYVTIWRSAVLPFDVWPRSSTEQCSSNEDCVSICEKSLGSAHFQREVAITTFPAKFVLVCVLTGKRTISLRGWWSGYCQCIWGLVTFPINWIQLPDPAVYHSPKDTFQYINDTMPWFFKLVPTFVPKKVCKVVYSHTLFSSQFPPPSLQSIQFSKQ